MSSIAFLHAATYALTQDIPPLHRGFMNEVKAEDIEEIINVHALGAAAAGLTSDWIFGGHGMEAATATVGFIWSMYYRINQKLGLSLPKSILKSLGTTVMINASGIAMVLSCGREPVTNLSFTGICNVMSSTIMGSLDYARLIVSGAIYLKLLVELFKVGRDPRSMTVDDLGKAAADVARHVNVGQMVKEAQGAYRQARKRGEATGKESVELEKD